MMRMSRLQAGVLADGPGRNELLVLVPAIGSIDARGSPWI